MVGHWLSHKYDPQKWKTQKRLSSSGPRPREPEDARDVLLSGDPLNI